MVIKLFKDPEFVGALYLKRLAMFSVIDVIHLAPGVREFSSFGKFPWRLFELAKLNPDIYLYGYRHT